MEGFAILATIVAAIGNYKLKIKKQRAMGLIRFEPYVPRMSQQKRRQLARRCA